MSENLQIQHESVKLNNAQIFDLARSVVPIAEKFYQDPKNEEGFQQWLKNKQASMKC